MKIGYIRVSTHEQNMDGQIDALREAGCEKLFQETASGTRADRPVLKECLSFARTGDVIVVYKLDRIARSLPHLIETMQLLERKDVGFHSVTEAIDTGSPGGRLLFHLLAALAEFERDLIVERTQAGLAAAKKKGRFGGRPRRMTPDKVDAARKLLDDGTPVRDVAAMLSVSVPTVYRWLPGTER